MVRRLMVGITAVVLVLIGAASGQEATASNVAALSMTQQVVTTPSVTTKVVESPGKVDAVTKKCGTGGYSYETDSMFVTQSYTGSGYIYDISRSPNRNVQVGNHTYTHFATAITVYYSAGNTKTYPNPGNSLRVTSGLSTVDFMLTMKITLDFVNSYYKYCSVNF